MSRKLNPDAICWAVLWRVTEPLNSESWLALAETTSQSSYEHVFNAVDAAVIDALRRQTDSDFSAWRSRSNFKQFVLEVHLSLRSAL